jgi:lactate dehydrogenase-like 2-hydroxyacid dehydrogenase
MWTGPRQRPLVYYTHTPPEAGPALLRERCDVRIFTGPGSPGAETIALEAAAADALCFFVPDVLDAALMDRLPEVRVLAGFGKGYDNVDITAATVRRLWVTNVPDALTDATADLAWALLLNVVRGVSAGDRFVRSGAFMGWSTNARLGMALTGETLGIVGYGAIGRAIARRADGFGMRVVYTDVASGMSLDELLGIADVVVLAVPLTGDTRYLIGAQRLALMRRTAFLVNVARGSIVDEAAVADALARGTIAGYAADVFELEDHQYSDRRMTIDARLLQSEHTLLTPHIGTATAEDRARLAVVQAQSVLAVIDGRRPATAVNDPFSG